MTDSPRSEHVETRYSTPAPELDDHRFLSPSLPRAGLSRDNMTTPPEIIAPVASAPSAPDGRPIFRDFEQVVSSDEPMVDGLRPIVRPSIQPSFDTKSRVPSTSSSRSSSPPNSVEAFAEPRRRERANTLESIAPSDLDGIHRSVSAVTQPRRPTFSSIIRPDVDSRVHVPERACLSPYEDPTKTTLIDYEELEEFVAIRKKTHPQRERKQSISPESRTSKVFYDLRPGAKNIGLAPGDEKSLGPEQPTTSIKAEHSVDRLENKNNPNRYSFFSSESQSTIHACELGDLVLPGDSFRDLFHVGPGGGVWWLDVLNPDQEELGAIASAFSIHPLTTEDIMTQEAREKVELFKNYYFVCFRTFYMDKASNDFLEPVHIYIVVFRQGTLSFSFTEHPHSTNVRKRIGRLREYVSLSSDWICYAMIDDIVDSFGPIIREVERESETIEDHVFIARVEDFNVFLPQIGHLRKKVMSLMRLLGGKADVIKGFAKRCNEQYSVTPRGDIGLYLGDIQDHVVTMMSNLGHFEKILSRSHANYLAQLNVTNLMLGNHVNKVLSKVTFLATILVPLNLICGLFGMNVHVPGQDSPGYGWFFGILGVIGFISVVSVILARRYHFI